MKHLIAVSQKTIENIKPEHPSILISIRSPGDEIPTLHEGWLEVLYLAFHDTDQEGGDLQPFSPLQAKLIADMARDANDDNVAVWINCGAGMSRSVGVGIALEEFYRSCGQDCELSTGYRRELANKHVLRTLRKEFFPEGQYEE